jgi:group I intron endonuclease
MCNYIPKTVDLNEFFGEIEEKLSNSLEEINGIIYKITNLITGKVYIGQTKHSIEKRFKEHIRTSFSDDRPHGYIHKSIRKYGIENFSVEQIDSAKTHDELNEKERYWITQEDSLSPNGYNLVSGGKGKGMSEETRERIRSANLGKKLSEKTRQALLKATTGRIQSEETKRKIGDGNRGKYVSEETRKKLSDLKSGKPRDEETKRKLSKSLKKMWEKRKLKHFYNPETEISIHIDPEQDEIPEGFIPGRGKIKRIKRMSEETKKKIGSTSKDTVWYHDVESGKTRKFKIGSEIPEGYEKGRLKNPKP